MNFEEFKVRVTKINKITAEFDISNQNLANIFGRDSTAENKFLTHFYNLKTEAIFLLAQLVNDKGDWLYWYFETVHPNKTKIAPYAVVGGKKYDCRNLKDIWNIINDCNNLP